MFLLIEFPSSLVNKKSQTPTGFIQDCYTNDRGDKMKDDISPSFV
jgi:hypothetical protein